MCRMYQAALLAAVAMTATSARAQNFKYSEPPLPTVESYYQPAPGDEAPSPSDIVPAPGQDDAVESYDPLDDELGGPTWRFSADALFLQRSAGNPFNLGETRTNPAGVLVDTLAIGRPVFPLEPGARFQLTHQLENGVAWEGVYFGLQQWSGRRTILADPLGATTLATSPQLQTDDLIGGFDTSVGYVDGSRLHNVEINRRTLRRFGPNGNCSTLVGVRYFNWRETFRQSGFDDFTGTFENLDVRTNNHLIGLQIGGRLTHIWDYFSLVGELKGGVYGNAARQRISNLDSSGIGGNPPGFVPIDSTTNVGSAAGIIDGSIVGRYWLTERFSLRAGYQLLLIPGLSLASNQSGGPNSSGFQLLHGPSAGVDWVW